MRSIDRLACRAARSREATAGWLGVALLLGALVPAGASADALDTLTSAAEQTVPLVDVRVRLESVDEDGFDKQADALTARSRLGFETGQAWNTSLLAEADLMWPLEERYNSTVNGLKQYPVVADPENYALNRLQLANTSLPDTLVVIGRQRINLDDQRFVGSVNWRQNEQTFDAARVVNTSIPNLTFDLTYLDRVNRIYGTESPVGRYTGSTYLANVGYQTPIGKLTAFDYVMDFNQSPTDSSQTRGVRLAGKRPIAGPFGLAWSASWARQTDYENNPLRYAEDYYTGELTGNYRGLSLGGGLEMLQGNGVKGFDTPLATTHSFDGWADQFLTTPPNGLQRRYAKAGYEVDHVGPLDSVALTAFYDDFYSDRLDMHYGDEADLQLLAKWGRFSALLQYADYHADQYGSDTRKVWVEIDYVRQ